MNVLRWVLRGDKNPMVRISNSDTDLNTLCNDDELIDVLDVRRTRLSLVVDDNSSEVDPDKNRAIPRTGFNDMDAAGMKTSQGNLIEDVASSESTSLLYDSSDDEESAVPSHCHGMTTSNQLTTSKAKWQLSCACFLCLCFMIAEIIGGYFSNSLAIVSDAAHMMTDLTGFGLSIAAIYISERKPTQKLPFGFYRAEILGAVSSVLLIWVLTGILVYSAINRLQSNNYDINADAMILVSALGVVMNAVMGLILHGWMPCIPKIHRQHSHGHSHDHNINVRAAMVHVFGDLLQSIGVLISAYVIKYKPEYKMADPICTFMFSALVLCTTFGIIRDAGSVLMEAFPSKLNYPAIRLSLEAIEGVKHVHSLRAWNLSMQKVVLSVHLAVEATADREKVLICAQKLLRRKFKLADSTIQIEKYDRQLIAGCDSCNL